VKILRQLMLILSLLLITSGVARAEPHDGFYAGASVATPVLNTMVGEDDLGTFNLDTDPGSLIAVKIGYDLSDFGGSNAGRIEIEYAERSNTFTQATFSDATVAATGEVTVNSLLLNTYAVYHLGSPVAPYFGVGLGGAQIKIAGLSVGNQPMLDDDALVFACQGGAGLDIDVNSWLRLDIGYRYLYLQQPEFTESDGREVKFDYGAHSGMVGVAFKF